MGFFMSETSHDNGAVSLDFVLENQTRLYQGMHKGVLKELYAEQFDHNTRRGTFTSWNTEPYHEVPFDEVSGLVVLPEDATDFVYAHWDYYIKATVGEVEGVFYAAEHFNYGRGYMMLERDGKIRGVVSSRKLENPVALEPRHSDKTDTGKTTMMFKVAGTTRPAVRTLSLENPPEARIEFRMFCVENPVEYILPPVTQVQLRGECATAAAASEKLKEMLAGKTW